MRLRRSLAAVIALGLLAGTAVLGSPTAGAATNRSLAEVLLADGDQFDRNPYDFDIVTEAVLAVLAAKPDSPVGLLTDGDVALTAFIPNDRAFQVLVGDLTGKYYGFYRFDESKVFGAVAGLGIDAVEAVLLYHVIPGATIDSATAVKSNKAVLTTAQGGTIKVKVVWPAAKWIVLQDQDTDDLNPFLVPSKLDINKGNPQIAHGIGLVLRPLDVESLLG